MGIIPDWPRGRLYMAHTCTQLFTIITILAALALPEPLAAAPSGAKFPGNAGWEARIVPHAFIPSQLVAVDKQRQALFVFEHSSPLRMTEQYACATGQVLGDKEVSGDLKTPEGIYFVVRRLDSGLDFIKYGNVAYTLNYPNPIDKLRKKTGYGIWIHGRGTAIVPRETEGCIALNNGDIAALGKKLIPGAPIALASVVVHDTKPDDMDEGILALLEEKSHGWAKAWAGRSPAFFDYYDPVAYTLAQGEPFDKFRAQKAGLFTALPWIETKIDNVQVLQGPGYWVSWFRQEYRAPNISTQGIRRLYWQKDAEGELRIAGMEWEPRRSGPLTAGLGASSAPPMGNTPAAAPAQQAERKSTTPEERRERFTAEGAAFVERWRAAWQQADITAYMQCYGKEAVQGKSRGAAAIRAHKTALWKTAGPAEIKLADLRIALEGDNIKVDMSQEYSDHKGYSDKGIKTLLIRQYGSSWRIIREDWRSY